MRTGVRLLFLLTLSGGALRAEGEVRLLTDDAIPRYLARGQELARAEQWDKVVDVLHRVVVGDRDIFPDLRPEVLHSAVYSEDDRIFYPARELCLKELARLPPEGLEAYRAAYDGEAQALFAAAGATDDVGDRLARYGEVYDRYLPSSVGDDALEKAGDLHLAQGRFYEALALYRRLVDLYPKDTDRDIAMVLAKAAFCAARIGDREHRDSLLERLAGGYGGTRIRVQGEMVPAASLVDHALMAVRGGDAGDRPGEWPVPGGNPARSRVPEDLPEDLPARPLWSFRVDERDARLHAADGLWIVSQHDREPSATPQELNRETAGPLAPYPTVRPVVTDGMVLYKDGVEVVARRLSSGAYVILRPRYEIPDPAMAIDPRYRYPLGNVRPGASGNPVEAGRFEKIYRYYDFGGATVASGSGHFLSVEWDRAPSDLLTTNPLQGPPNTLFCYDERTGKTKWAWVRDLASESVRHDPETMAAWERDFEAHPAPQFFGPGVVSGNLAYTLAKEHDGLAGVSLWCFDLEDGRVRYRTPLHYADETEGLLPRGATVSLAGGTAYVLTHAGILAAVDALPPGRVRWISRYERYYAREPRGRRSTKGIVKQGFAYQEPLVAGGKVFVAPADSDELLAFDAETGRIAWSIARDKLAALQVHTILGMSQGVLVLSGDKVVGVDAMRRGEKLWGPVKLEGWPRGRGFVGRRYAHVPTSHDNARRAYVERFDVLTGEPAKSLEFQVSRLGNIVPVEGRLLAANEEEVLCFTTVEAELKRIDAAIESATRKAPWLFDRALVHLAAEPKDRGTAREDFRRALRAADEEGTPNTTWRARALENLFALAAEQNDLTAIAEARELVKGIEAHEMLVPEGTPHPYAAQAALLEVRVLGRLGRGAEALQALEGFLDTCGGTQVVMDDRVVEAEAAARKVREHLLASDAAFRRAFEESVRSRMRGAVERGDADELRSIPERYGNLPPSEESHLLLAGLLEEAGRLGEAEVALRNFLDSFPEHPRRGEAHLRLALFLARSDRMQEARAQRDEGLSRLDEAGRGQAAAVLGELERLLPGAEPAAVRVRLRIPMQPHALDLGGAAPVAVEGALPDGILVSVRGGVYRAHDRAGAVLWTQSAPGADGLDPGPPGDPATTAVAASLANARLAFVVDGDVVFCDAAGMLRLDARTGEARWRYPRHPEEAAAVARSAVERLRADLARTRAEGEVPRALAIPAYARSGNLVLRVVPGHGVEAIDLDKGAATELVDGPLEGVPVGPPSVVGRMAAVGWDSPGRVFVYDLAAGRRVLLHAVAEKERLVAPPVLDPLGRLYVVTAPEGGRGRLVILDARTGERAHEAVLESWSAHAATLHADGHLLVFHDGGDGGENLHFLDLGTGRRAARRAPALLRDVTLLRDGFRLFVLTSTPGLEDTGARLFRIDLQGRDALEYATPPRGSAYGAPLLTHTYVACIASRPQGAAVRLYDREASLGSGAPQPVFVLEGGRETAELDFPPRDETRYDLPPALAARDGELLVAHPFGVFRLAGREAR